MKGKTRMMGLFTLIWLGSAIILDAQGTLADYQRAEKFIRNNVEKLIFKTQVNPHWIKGQNRFWYVSKHRQGRLFLLVDCRRRIQKPAFNHSRLANTLSKLLKKPYKASDLPFKSIEFLHNGRAIGFSVSEKRYKYWLGSGKCAEIKPSEKDPSISVSPDGKWQVTGKENNLVLKDLTNGIETQLTDDGREKFAYGTSWNWYYLMNESDPGQTKKTKGLQISWSPDSTKLITYRVDDRQSPKLYLYQSLPKSGYRAQVWSYYRSLPGEKRGTHFSYYIFDITKKRKTAVQLPPLHSAVNFDFPHWCKNSSVLYFHYYTRGYKKVKLVEINSNTGQVRTVVEESADTFIDTAKRFIHLIGKQYPNQVVWGSERDGWSHFYLYDWGSGRLINQITSGHFVVRRLLHVDDARGYIYFMASGRENNCDPYLQFLYRINRDGTGLILLTPEKAEHQIRLSPNKKYFVDTYSRVDLPPVSLLRRLKDGKTLMKLQQADIKDLLASGWQYPEPFTVKARDGETDLYGVIFRSTHFDPQKKYPVIDSSYSGPQAVRTPKSFRRGCLNLDQSLAELGFIVVTIDGLGTANRSKKFQDYSYKNLGDIGALDHITGIRQLAEKYPSMNLTRVGIYGHSAGGYDAAHALLIHPEFYKVAVSSAGNHDHRMAKAWWPEHYQGYPVGKQYGEQSNLTLARNLRGKLLLIHGDMDNNVNPASTLRLAAELIRANKDFDLILIPNRSHRLSNHPYFLRKLWDHFVRHLHGKKPPRYSITTKLN